jgi:hypothetical protein
MKIRPIPKLTKSDKDRFWAKVRRGSRKECWPWLAYTNKHGRGMFGIRRDTFIAPRVAYSITKNDPLDGLNANHSCDNPSCCNPAHIWPGTQTDGVSDMDSKGRRAANCGERNPSAKLKTQNVRTIRRSRDSSIVLADRFHVSVSLIRQIRRGEKWKQVK